jgi:hypothetical protein
MVGAIGVVGVAEEVGGMVGGTGRVGGVGKVGAAEVGGGIVGVAGMAGGAGSSGGNPRTEPGLGQRNLHLQVEESM